MNRNRFQEWRNHFNGICCAAFLLIGTACSSSPGTPAAHTPQLGDDDLADRTALADVITPMYAGNDTSDPKTEVFYTMHFGSQDVQITPDTFADHAGVLRLGTFDLRVAKNTLHDDTAKALLIAFVPNDARRVNPTKRLRQTLGSFLMSGTDAHSITFYRSTSLAATLGHGWYYQGKAWKPGSCPLADPGELAVFRDYEPSGRLKILAVTSLYLPACQRDPAAP